VIATIRNTDAAGYGLSLRNGSDTNYALGIANAAGTITAWQIRGDGTAVASNGSTLFQVTSTGLNSTAIGATTPSTGAFTTVSATGLTTIASSAFVTSRSVPASGAGLEMYYQSNASGLLSYDRTGSAYKAMNIGATTVSIESSGSGIAVFSSTGLAVTGALSATGTITATGSIFTGTTAEITPTSGTQDGMSLNSAGLLTISRNSAGCMQVRRRTSDGNLQVFFRDTTSVGSIQVTTTGTTFTTTSDYRLKNITGPLTDSGTFIDSLKPKTGTWKSNNSKFVGFLAHEFAEISPSSVAGEKDAVDDDGNPSYQSMQASSPEVIANLVAELQSLRKRLAALESK
jgi:hypothetical protein